MGLLEGIIKFSKTIYEDYNLNITKYPTLPSLALAIYGYWSYDNEKYSFKMTTGLVENKFIRLGYYGGNSDIVKRWGDICYGRISLDIIYKNPNAISGGMPTGDPVFSNNTDLNYYECGFVYAKITPPSESKLKIYLSPIETQMVVLHALEHHFMM